MIQQRLVNLSLGVLKLATFRYRAENRKTEPQIEATMARRERERELGVSSRRNERPDRCYPTRALAVKITTSRFPRGTRQAEEGRRSCLKKKKKRNNQIPDRAEQPLLPSLVAETYSEEEHK